MKKIGFIGLGKMGLPMAVNLCKADFELYVKSSNQSNQNIITQNGGKSIEDFAHMAKECDVIITILPADQEIMEVYTKDNGIIANAKDGLVCIDMTSAKGTTKEKIAELFIASGKNIKFLDAPVSGGVAGATNGTLTIMVGSEKEDYDSSMDVLKALGTKIIYTGQVGTASNVKMLNQMLNAANTAIAAEVLCISRGLGVDDKVLSEVVNQSSGASFIFEKNVPKYMMTGDHTPGFRLNLMKKDIGLFADASAQLNGFTPISDLVYQIYRETANEGHGDMNYTYVYKWFEENQ